MAKRSTKQEVRVWVWSRSFPGLSFTPPYSNIAKTAKIIRAVFKWLSKVITWLRLLRLVIGLKDSRQFFNQWDAKPKPIHVRVIFPALRASYMWLLGVVIGSWSCLFLLWLVKVITQFKWNFISDWNFFPFRTNFAKHLITLFDFNVFFIFIFIY